MKLQSRILIIIIPFVLISLLGLGLWSFVEAKKSIYHGNFRYMRVVLESYTAETLHQNHQLLKDAKMDQVASYVESYKQDSINKAKSLATVRGGHIFAINKYGKLAFTTQDINSSDIESSWNEISKQIVDGNSAEIIDGYIDKKPYNDVYVAQYFKPWGWVVFYSIPDKDVSVLVNRIRLITLGMSVLCALVSSFLIFVFCKKYLLIPIAKLNEAAKSIAAHENIENISIFSTDELGRLARSMETMSKSIGTYKNEQEKIGKTLIKKHEELQKSQSELKLYQDSLEQLVDERTIELKKSEKQLQQSQKMESIGTLAGGIAHDFNNILSAILGYAEMAKDDCQPGSSISKDLDEVLGAGNRAKNLVQQILAFSRQDDVKRTLIQPASIVQEVIHMLRPSLPTTIEINRDIGAVTGLIFVDPSQFNQILMNLCTNAFHAMEDNGGKLDISLKEVTLSSEDLIHELDIANGTFIQLSIADSGTGIPATIKDKIFDPYFSTKEVGKGTGMGLATVHGIVKSYGGFVSCFSELGAGSVFHVFLPTVEQEVLAEIKDNDQILIGRERILFVDDEEILTTMGKTMLERLGYHVTVRNSSFEALETFQKHPDKFDIVITDQTMPGMTGSDLSRRMLQIRPDIPIILCTGYSTIISEEKAKSMGIKEFAFKPLAKKDIAKLIRKVLDVS